MQIFKYTEKVQIVQISSILLRYNCHTVAYFELDFKFDLLYSYCCFRKYKMVMAQDFGVADWATPIVEINVSKCLYKSLTRSAYLFHL